MTRRIVVSPRARSDLEEIWDYTEAAWSEEQAEQYLREVWRAIEHVAADHRRGRSRDELRAGYFSYLVASHVIFYRLTPDTLDVVRILHARRDFPRHL